MPDRTDMNTDQKNEIASTVYRGADGRPHLVAAQEQAARDAQQSDKRARPALTGLTHLPPD